MLALDLDAAYGEPVTGPTTNMVISYTLATWWPVFGEYSLPKRDSPWPTQPAQQHLCSGQKSPSPSVLLCSVQRPGLDLLTYCSIWTGTGPISSWFVDIRHGRPPSLTWDDQSGPPLSGSLFLFGASPHFWTC